MTASREEGRNETTDDVPVASGAHCTAPPTIFEQERFLAAAPRCPAADPA
jgi:hypothetical protein